MADALLRNLTTYETTGTQWAVLQRWIKQACINAGIVIPMSDPLLRDLTTYDSEGTRFAVIQRWLTLLANNLTGGSAGVSQLIAGANITLSPPTGQGVVTVSASGGGGSGIPSQQTFANSTGNTTLTPASGNGIAVGTITGAARTSIFVLDVAGRADNDIFTTRFEVPAVAGIIIEVRNASAVGTLLYTYTTDGVAGNNFIAETYFKTGAWHPLLNVQPVV